MEKSFKEKLSEKSPELTLKMQEQFEKYMKLLLEWNEKINLTAITEEDDIILKHFVDSLTISKYIEDGKTLVDVGTGAGFPGVPVKIARENVKVTLVDSLNKRLLFLQDVIEKLQLKEIETLHFRAEEFGQNKKYRESFDIATSRAVANLSTLVEYLLPLVKVGGICICMKGSEVQEELEESKKAIQILGGEILKVEEFTLPESDIKRNIVIIKKISKTPNKYPRKPGTPSKEPIK